MIWHWGIILPLLVAVYTDWRWHKLFNWLTIPTFVLGLLLSFGFGGVPGLISSLQGAGLCFGILLILFLLRGMGAGDVKLMTGIGAWLGLSEAGEALIATAIAGGVLAILFALRYGVLKKVLGRIKVALVATVLGGSPQEVLAESAGPPFPYGLAIAAGTLAALIIR